MDRNPDRTGLRAVLAPWGCLLLALLLLVGAPAIVVAEDPPEEGKEGDAADENPLEVCEDKQARELAKELTKVAKKKSSTDVLPVLEKIEDLRHEEFEKPLLRLLKHESSLVAVKAAEMWEWRVTEKNASKVWKASWGEKKNEKRFVVNALVLKAFARAGIALDDKEFKEVERGWRWIVGNPEEANAPALTAIAEWVEASKDKRLFRKLAEEIDEPGTNVNANDPSNPPADWWERRWKLWNGCKAAVHAALKALTGQDFKKTADAKAWLDENEKTFGVKW